jgi:branched-chain amino acid transport system ATP-binding protein
MAVVLVEQLVDKALRVADHVVVLQRGRVVIDRPADSVAEADLLDAYLGVSGTSASASAGPPQEPESRSRHNPDSIPLRHI